MDPAKRFLLILGCMVCLLAVAAMLPTADPRLEGPGGETDQWEGVAGDSNASVDSPEEYAEADTDDPAVDFDLFINGTVAPGNEIRFQSYDVGAFEDTDIYVDGSKVGSLNGEEAVSTTVPYNEEMQVSAPAEGYEKTIDIPTDATLQVQNQPVPARELGLGVYIRGTSIPDVPVYHEGEEVGETNESGVVTVDLPESAGPTNVSVARGPIEASQTVSVPEPDIDIVSMLQFPGGPVTARVTADGTGISNANVTLAGETVQTDENGLVEMRLPLADSATITTEVGAESDSTSVGSLYLRLAAVIIFVPGLVIGIVVTYFRIQAWRHNRQYRSIGSMLLVFGGSIALLGRGLGSLIALSSNLRLPRFSLPSFGWPSFSVPLGATGLSGSFSVPRFSMPSLPRFAFPSLSVAFPSGFGNPFSKDNEPASDRSADVAASSVDGDAPPVGTNEGRPAPNVEIRRAWHRFCDRVGLGRRQTKTPGQVARRAVASGFPASSVRQLVSLFRDVEYGGQDPSREHAKEAQTTAAELADHDPEEDTQ